MGKQFIRLFAFFTKEVNEVRRQPKLVLSLIFGPFLILLLFGAGYQGDKPVLRTVLLAPTSLQQSPRFAEMKQGIEANFNIVAINDNTEQQLQAAMAQLQRREVDVVEVIPADIEDKVSKGQQASVDFRYNEINPLNESWIQYLGYAQISELNKAILRGTVDQFRSEAGALSKSADQLGQQLSTAITSTASLDRPQLQAAIRQTRDATDLFAASPLLSSQLAATGDNPDQAQQNLKQLRTNLDTIDKAVENGTLEQQRAQLTQARDQLQALRDVTGRISKLPSEVLVSPLQQQYQNIYGKPPDFMTFYAPSVLALILQHIAVTLGALSLVREKLLGAIEFYGVAPVWLTQVLLGKYLGYTMFIGIIAAVLIVLMSFLAVPFIGSIATFALFLLVFTLASLGIGFLVSALSSSDSQAVQLSMLVLLMSIFFSGFFLPLENFSEYVRPVGYVLPLTHGINGFQNVMLRGTAPDSFMWIALGGIAIVTFVAVMVVWRQQFRRIE